MFGIEALTLSLPTVNLRSRVWGVMIITYPHKESMDPGLTGGCPGGDGSLNMNGP